MQLAPPGPPPLLVALADDGRKNRFWFRHQLLVWSVLTILVTAWLMTLGPVSAILALVVAKHILVGILVGALGVDQSRDAE